MKATALFLLALVAAACGAAASGGEPRVPQRGGRPVPCGLWRLADPGKETDDYAFLPNTEMEEVRLAGPPISWSRVRDVRYVIVPWLKGANRVVEFTIEGLTPVCAGDRLLVVDDKLAIFGVKPATTPGIWRLEGTFSEEDLSRVERVFAGKNECATLSDPETAR